MASQVFDVLIIGAGPAGAFAADRLARAGKSVALFDGRPDSEAKACGGGVTSKALKAWPHLLHAVGRTVYDLEMYSPAGRRLHLELDEPFAIYSRRELDSFLVERAGQAGATVIRARVSVLKRERGASRWTVRGKNGTEWTGSMLVAADGASSRVAKSLAGSLPPAEMEVAFGYRAPLPRTGAAPTIVAFLPGWAGYAWAFPRTDHISFGIATSQDAFNHTELDLLLWKFMIGFYRMRDRPDARLWEPKSIDHHRDAEIRSDLETRTERYAARIPGLAAETWDKRRASGDSWALLGDAAGFADPVTGEGIYYALRSAELFSNAYIHGNPSSYEDLWRADFGRELKRASEMRGRFYGSFWGAPFTERMIELARSHRGIRRVLGKLVAGDQGYIGLKRKLAKSAALPL